MVRRGERVRGEREGGGVFEGEGAVGGRKEGRKEGKGEVSFF